MNGGSRRFRPLGVLLVVLCATPAMPVDGQGALVRLETAPGSKASYLVREQLAGFDLPGDAVGTTEAIAGSLVLAPDGTFDRERSRLTLDLATLTSDQSMRDNYLRTRTLEVEKFPKAEFVPRRVQGLTLPLPSTGQVSFDLVGDLTVHGVTAERTWAVTATLAPDRVTGRATTNFPFSTFGLQIPKLARLLSVDDNIRLELDLVLTRSSVQ
jgi:polyisoprenoid-binding protein YceI